MGFDEIAKGLGFCVSYCEHGGVCILEAGHESTHDSRYCRWTDKEAISREEADRRLSKTAGGPDFLSQLKQVFGEDDE